MVTYRSLPLFLAALAAVVAVIVGFRWLGTTGEDWPGWISLAVLLAIVDRFLAPWTPPR